VAMGLSSVIVVLNSLRLTRLGRSGLAGIRTPRFMHGRRGVAVSVALPIVLFAGLTLVSQAVSPARGQSLLPGLPALTVVALPDGGSVETYFEPGGPGVNQFHLIFSGSEEDVASTAPLVKASINDGPFQNLRQLRVSTGHFTDFVVLSPGRWRFRVATSFGSSTVGFTIHRTVQ